MSALHATLEVVGGVMTGEDPERCLSHALRSRPELTPLDRADVAHDSLGVACHRSRTRAYVEAARLEVSATTLLLAHWIHERHRSPEAVAERGGATIEVARALAMAQPAWPHDPSARLAMQESLPAWLAELWLREWGEAEAFALAVATNRPGPVTLRVNALRGSREAVAAQLAAEGIATRAGAHAPMALHVEGRANLFGSPAWRAGAFEVQDEGSQLITEVCAVRPGERWLDLCAGAGGKTLGLGAAMGNRGELWAAGIDAQQRDNLRARLQRSGVQARVIELDAERPGDALGREMFDGILVDAPCSELGTLRRHVGARWRLQPEAFAPLPALQRRLLEVAGEHLGPKGRLVYATCTLRRAENEEVVGPGWEMRTVTPHHEGTDGFFMAWRSGCGGEPGLK